MAKITEIPAAFIRGDVVYMLYEIDEIIYIDLIRPGEVIWTVAEDVFQPAKDSIGEELEKNLSKFFAFAERAGYFKRLSVGWEEFVNTNWLNEDHE